MKARLTLRAFALVPDDPTDPEHRKFLGDEMHTKHFGLAYTLKRLNEEIDACDDVEFFNVYQGEVKQLQAMIAVSKEFLKSAGCATDRFIDIFKSMNVMLAKDPSVAVDWPSPVMKLVRDAAASQADDNVFWTLVDATRLREEGHANPMQASLEKIADRIAGINKEDFDKKLKALVDASPAAVGPNIKLEINAVKEIVESLKDGYANFAELQKAHALFSDVANVILQAVCAGKHGQALLNRSQLVLSRHLSWKELEDKIHVILAKMSHIKKQDFHAIDLFRHLAGMLGAVNNLFLKKGVTFDTPGVKPMQDEFDVVVGIGIECWKVVMAKVVARSALKDIVQVMEDSAGVAAGFKSLSSLAFFNNEAFEPFVAASQVHSTYRGISRIVELQSDAVEKFSEDEAAACYRELVGGVVIGDVLQQRLTDVSTLCHDFGVYLFRTLPGLSKPMTDLAATIHRKVIPFVTELRSQSEACFKGVDFATSDWFDRAIALSDISDSGGINTPDGALEKLLQAHATLLVTLDFKTARQVSYVLEVLQLMQPLSKLGNFLLRNKTPESRIVTADLAAKVAQLRDRHNSLLVVAKTSSADDLKACFGDAAEVRIRILDGLSVPEASVICDHAMRIMCEFTAIWQADVVSLTNRTAEHIPAWSLVKDTILDHEGVVKAMVLNEHFADVHAANELLLQRLCIIEPIMKNGKLIDAGKVKDARTASRAASEYIIHAFAIMVVMDTVPKLVSPAARKKEMPIQKAIILDRCKKEKYLSVSIRRRMDTLASGAVCTRIDFNALQAEISAAKAASTAAATAARIAAIEPAPAEETAELAAIEPAQAAEFAAIEPAQAAATAELAAMEPAPAEETAEWAAIELAQAAATDELAAMEPAPAQETAELAAIEPAHAAATDELAAMEPAHAAATDDLAAIEPAHAAATADLAAIEPAQAEDTAPAVIAGDTECVGQLDPIVIELKHEHSDCITDL